MQRERQPVLETTEPRQSAEPPQFTEVHYRMWARFAGPAWLRRLLGDRNGLRLDAEGLSVRLGSWLVTTPLDNLAGARVTGPYRTWRALGPHLSFADRGLTLGTTTERGVCLGFRGPVRGLDPWGLVRHPSLTVTVDEPELVAEVVNRVADHGK
ncbi:hypothetical protein [Amycolatopsis sp. NPDC051372]|uniref:hypothetical protein n=1 Tax=Amycolatopsis sp. NPDC051372 TaxID=3155669 RepID=UPI0034204086